MTFKSCLSVFLIALALLFSANAFAANEKGSRCSDGIDNDGDGLVDGDDPDCGGDVGAAKTWTLLDGNASPIGEFMGLVSSRAAIALITIGEVEALISVSPFRIGKDTYIYYKTPDCSGQGYVASSAGRESFFGRTAVAEHDSPIAYGEWTYSLYMVGQSAETESFPPYRLGWTYDVNDVLVFECHPVSQGNYKPVDLVYEGLEQLYPPPYTLVKQ